MPLAQLYDSYYGKPFAWCMLHNYGGRRDLYGNLSRIATGPVVCVGMANEVAHNQNAQAVMRIGSLE